MSSRIDPELAAMAAVQKALAGLSPPERVRVIRWADVRLGQGDLADTLHEGMKVLSAGLDAIMQSAAHHQVSPRQMRIIADRLLTETYAEIAADEDAGLAEEPS